MRADVYVSVSLISLPLCSSVTTPNLHHLYHHLHQVGAQVPDATLPGGVAGELVGDWEVVHVQADRDLLSTSTYPDVPLRSRFKATVQRACRAGAFRRFRDEGAGYDDVGEGEGEARRAAADSSGGGGGGGSGGGEGSGEEGVLSPTLAVLASDDLRLPLVPLFRLRLWRIGSR